MFGSDSGRDPHELRSTAKMVNYALLYGKTAFTLAKDIGVTPQVAQEFIDAYFAGFPRVRAFIDKTLEDARTTGVVKTIYGRRRLVPELTAGTCRFAGCRTRSGEHADSGHRSRHPEARDDRHARRAGARAHGARMILTVHDELLFEWQKEQADETAAIRSGADAERGAVEGAADGRCRDRRQLAGREELTKQLRIVKGNRECRSCGNRRHDFNHLQRLAISNLLFHCSLNSVPFVTNGIATVDQSAQTGTFRDDRCAEQAVDVGAQRGAARCRATSGARTQPACAASQAPCRIALAAGGGSQPSRSPSRSTGRG